MRVPVRQVQAYLATFPGLTLSLGESVEGMHRLKGEMEPPLAGLKAAI